MECIAIEYPYTMKKNLSHLFFSLIAFVVAYGLAWLTAINLVMNAVFLSFLIQWILFAPAYYFQTEKFYDLAGSMTYLTVVIYTSYAGYLMTGFNLGSIILGLIVIIWALRLGIFLFTRIHSIGEDKRFQTIIRSPSQFFMTWTLQGMWVAICSACALTAIANGVVLNRVFLMGFLVFIFGFSIEIIADHQKSSFRKNPVNRGHFIKTGLWAYSKHPNYLGEIILWVGIAICSLSSLSGLQLMTLISPVFTYVLLVYISGIPLLKARGKQKWGHLSQYQEYVDRTPTLFFNPLKSFSK